MAAGILVPNAHLVGLWLQMLATGAYFVYLPQCVSFLRKKLRQGLSLWLPAACALMFVTTVIDLVVEMVRGYHAFSVKGKEPPNPALFYADPATPESLLKNALNVVVAVVSDGIIVYRTFIVWNMNLAVVLVPTATVFANIAIGIWAMWTLSRTEPGDALVLAAVTARIRVFFVLTFCVNALCAGLICYKIWRVHALARRVADGSVTGNVLEIVIESAALYCAYLFCLIVSSSVGSNVFFIFLDPLPPVTAVIFSMLIVRAHTGAPRPAPSRTQERSTIHFYTRTLELGARTTTAATTADHRTTTATTTSGAHTDTDTDGDAERGIAIGLATVPDTEGSLAGDSVSRIGYRVGGEVDKDSSELDLAKV
ncbi:hypothetical protein C8Q78DRAFT_34271 [Trametes maxima]|nr:hypothetical protein C8Q78DRAFT_34271 [Trametes maxima]